MMPWRKRTIRALGPEAPVTHSEIRKLMLRVVMPVCAVTLTTSVAAGALSYWQGPVQRGRDDAARTRENAAAICEGQWQRYLGREGVRDHFMNELERILEVTQTPDPLRTALLEAEQRQLDIDLPASELPDCPFPDSITP